MSDSEDTLVASATALVETYQAIDAPTLDDLNALTSGIALLLNRSEITSDETAQIITILSSLLDTVTTISGSDVDYSFMGIELSQLTTEMNVKFLNCVNSILMDPSVDWLGYWSKVSPLISPYLSSTSTISKAEYSALWTSISNVLSGYLGDTTISEMEKRFNAILTMYFNLNYSNLMTKTLSEATILGFLVANLQVSLITTYDLTSNVSQLLSNVNVFFTDNGLDTNGMNASEFITACKDTLAYLSLHLTSDQISAIKTSMTSFISESFFTSTTCESKVMALSSASTLTTSLTSSFGVGAIPLTPTASASLIDGLPMVILMYPFFSPDEYSEINSAVSTYLAGTSYTTLGLTATQVGEIWGVIKSTATPKMTDRMKDTSEVTDTPEVAVSVSDFLIMMQTAFNNLLSVTINDNINYVLSATGFYDSASQDLILIQNQASSTLDTLIAGNFLNTWLDTFITNLSSDIGVIPSSILKQAIIDMFTADNNLNSDGSYEITGNIFIQIGIEILTFLNNLSLTSDKLEIAAANFTTRLMKLVYVSDYSAAYILGATIIGEVLLTILLIVLTVVTLGAASAGLVAEAAVTAGSAVFEATYTSLSTVATAATPLLAAAEVTEEVATASAATASAAVATTAATAGLLSSLTLGQAYLLIGVVMVVDTVAFAADAYVAALASDNFMNSEDDITLTDQ